MAALFKKPSVKMVALTAAFVLCVFVGIGLLVKNIATKDLLEQKIEESINAEVVIGGVEVSIFNFPAKLVITDISLMPKAASVPAEAPVKIGEISLSIGWLGLFQKHIDVKHIGIKEADIKITYHKDGTTSLKKLFQSPDEAEGEVQESSKKEQGGFNIHEQGDFVASLGGLSISNSSLNLVLEEMGLQLECQDLQVELSSIEIDPNDLVASNEAKLKLQSLIRVYSDKREHYGDLYIDGLSGVSLFNVTTGDIEAEVDGEFRLSDQSWLSTNMPFISRSWEQLSVLKKVGLNVGRVPERATFGRSKSISAHYHLGRIRIIKALSIWVEDWEVAILGGGWLSTQTDQHDVRGELLASKKTSAVMAPTIFKGLELLPKELRASVADDVKENLFRDERLLVKIKSTGDFSDPKIRPDGKIIDLSKATKGAAGELLKQKAGSLLKDLLK